MTDQETVFEAPVAHESGGAGGGFGWETRGGSHESGRSEPEGVEEMPSYEATSFEDEATAYEDEGEAWAGETMGPWSGEEEADPFLGGLLQGALGALGLGEGEADPFLGGIVQNVLSGLGLGEGEGEWTGEGEWSGEEEADQFLGGALKALAGVARRAIAPAARALAPTVTRALSSLVPGGALLAGPLGRLLPQLLGQAEGEVAALEGSLLSGAASGESGEVPADRARDAQLTEVLAAESVLAESDAEAAAVLGATLPLTITIMGARRSARPVLPALVQGQRRLVGVLRGSGPAGAQLQRLVPAIDRRTAATIRRLRRRGRPITAPVALAAQAAAARSVLGNPALVRRTVMRNGSLRLRTVPPRPVRVPVYTPRPPVHSYVRTARLPPPAPRPRPSRRGLVPPACPRPPAARPSCSTTGWRSRRLTCGATPPPCVPSARRSSGPGRPRPARRTWWPSTASWKASASSSSSRPGRSRRPYGPPSASRPATGCRSCWSASTG
jgi:hypothetical protein